jgi:hypothetical protein
VYWQSANFSQSTSALELFYLINERYGRQTSVQNTKLKKLLAEQMLDNAIHKDIASKKWCRPMPSGTLWFTPAPSMQ